MVIEIVGRSEPLFVLVLGEVDAHGDPSTIPLGSIGQKRCRRVHMTLVLRPMVILLVDRRCVKGNHMSRQVGRSRGLSCDRDMGVGQLVEPREVVTSAD